MSHYAFIWVFGHYFFSHKPGTGELVIVITSGVILLVGFAYLVMVLYDIPVRRYFSNKRSKAL
jgi:hypothetical protein